MPNDIPKRFIHNPDEIYKQWNIVDIFPTGSYVPNPDDSVIDWKGNTIYRVDTVDHTTGLSTLVPWESKRSITEITNIDVLIGVGPGIAYESYRAYLDTRTVPYILQADGRLHIYDSAATYAKIFMGTKVQGSDVKVISAYYDQNGNFLGENIPLELVATECNINISIKSMKTGYTHEEIQNGQTVTVVFYSDTGSVVSYANLIVHNTSLVRPLEAGMKYVTGVSLISPFLSKVDNKLLEFPLGINTDSIPMMGVVEYSDRSTKNIPIQNGSGGRFQLFGLNHYTPTNENQTIRLTLNYILAPDEVSYLQGPTANGSITERYVAKTRKFDGAYSLKLFAFPTWIDHMVGYGLEFYLYNLDRRIFHRVPRDKVLIASNRPNWDGLNYLNVQNLVFDVNLKDVDPQYKDYRHVQPIAISLKSQGTENRTNWTIEHTPGSGSYFGVDVTAKARNIDQNITRFNIANDCTTVKEWLNKLYYPVEPLFDSWKEPGPIEPNYFAIRTKRRVEEFHIDFWDKEINIINDLAEGETIFIEWMRRTDTTTLQLGVSGLPVHFY